MVPCVVLSLFGLTIVSELEDSDSDSDAVPPFRCACGRVTYDDGSGLDLCPACRMRFVPTLSADRRTDIPGAPAHTGHVLTPQSPLLLPVQLTRPSGAELMQWFRRALAAYTAAHEDGAAPGMIMTSTSVLQTHGQTQAGTGLRGECQWAVGQLEETVQAAFRVILRMIVAVRCYCYCCCYYCCLCAVLFVQVVVVSAELMRCSCYVLFLFCYRSWSRSFDLSSLNPFHSDRTFDPPFCSSVSFPSYFFLSRSRVHVFTVCC